MTVLASGIILYRAPTRLVEPTLLLLRNADNGQWGFPKGRRDPQDSHELVTAVREVREETGYTDLSIHLSFRRTLEYRVEGAEDHGRRKRVVYFMAPAPEIEPVLSAEHDGILWADYRKLQTAFAYGQLRDLAFHALLSIPIANDTART
jgi:8-oxo-dGTP pyrophosphatase MutT (NUDIX family)